MTRTCGSIANLFTVSLLNQLGKLPIIIYMHIHNTNLDCQRTDSNRSLTRSSVKCITNYATLAFGSNKDQGLIWR